MLFQYALLSYGKNLLQYLMVGRVVAAPSGGEESPGSIGHDDG